MTTTSPQNDFYQWVNNSWLENEKIPDDYSSWGGFTKLYDEGLNNLIKYQLVLNYNDMGMDDDLIYFQNTDGESVEYIYDFKNDTLKLFEISCKYYEGKHCAAIERGNIVYQLSKNSD